ncbi:MULTISPECIES: MurR/RpiR family transcriptional regulator [Thermomonosporaceae]|uniref:MurR/RpiR family transcriptional regulator n=1 Tax=Thermomonosporaceae TaxID=2012 RepID=UPI00255AE621|nr:MULTISPECIES: SIS domain-containing protein [Thermomonosporaceae]MDL4775787.1 SIS domain-containing protein [Actinomadura xylanilytica]
MSDESPGRSGPVAAEDRRDAAAAENRRLSSPDARYGARLRRPSSASALLSAVIEAERANLETTMAGLQADGALELASARIVAARRRFILGSAKSRAHATLLHLELSASLAGVTLIDEAAVRAIDVLSDVRPTDVLVAFSFRRYARPTITVAREFAAAGGHVVAITDDAGSPLAEAGDTTVLVGTGSASYSDSPTAISAVVHALATLTAASAKGARRRLARREDLAHALTIYSDE